MNIRELVDAFDLKVFSAEEGLDRVVSGGYVSDLLSDVMGKAECEQIWITLQTHKNVMAVASLKELAAVILVNGLEPDIELKAQSQEEGIPLLGTQLETFEIAGKLYGFINPPIVAE